jgi:ABC-type transport system involved in multi-copper enzyme maturation permease subunit
MELANPVLIKEMRTRMRGKRSFAIVTVYTFTFGVILGLFYWTFTYDPAMATSVEAGRYLTGVAVFVQMALICLISPTLTAASVTSEREQQTFDLLVASLATPSTILFGKVGASLGYLLLVLLASLPIVSFLYWVGGIALVDVAICYVVMLVAGVTYCTVSFLWSTLVRRGVLAQMLSVATVLTLVAGLPAFALFAGVMGAAVTRGQMSPLWENVIFVLLRTNPFYAQGSALFGGDGSIPRSIWLREVPVWVFQVAFYLGLTGLSGLLAWRRLASVRKWLV